MPQIVTENLIYLMKIGLALFLGLIVGHEREAQKKTAGLRDVILVTLGATLCAILSLEMLKLEVSYDVGRILAYTIASIGFLGSGVILQNKDKLEGITTACVLWVMVIVGLFCGTGNYILSILGGLSVYLILKLKHIQVEFETRRKRYAKKRKRTHYRIHSNKE